LYKLKIALPSSLSAENNCSMDHKLEKILAKKDKEYQVTLDGLLKG
jgi:hypothetical protein